MRLCTKPRQAIHTRSFATPRSATIATADVPAYQRIADELRRAIIDGTLPPGSRLPSVPELARTHRVTSRTAYEATKILLTEGLTTSKPGSGSTVRERPEIMRLVRSMYEGNTGKGSPWRAAMAAAGRVGTWESHSEEVPAPPAVAERLLIEPGDRTMRTEYVYLADSAPSYLATSWEPLALTLGTPILLPEDGPHAGNGVADRMAVIGHRPTRWVEELEPRPLTIAEGDLLALHSGISILVTHRTYYDGDLPLETADIVMPPHMRPVYEGPVSD